MTELHIFTGWLAGATVFWVLHQFCVRSSSAIRWKVQAGGATAGALALGVTQGAVAAAVYLGIGAFANAVLAYLQGEWPGQAR